MPVLLFAILDASHARCALVISRRALRKAQDYYERAVVTAEARANSKKPGVRQSANVALTAALDALDACRATFEAAQERSAVLDQIEEDAYAAPVPSEPGTLAQHRAAVH